MCFKEPANTIQIQIVCLIFFFFLKHSMMVSDFFCLVQAF